MTTHKLQASQLVPRPIEEVFDFFSRAENLARITPTAMGFDLRSDGRDMGDGLELEYRIRPVLGIPLTWRSRISDYNPPFGFRDIQVHGPYRHWEHVHSFKSVDGGTLVSDEVTYDLPAGPLGDIAHGLSVRHELEWIFRYRAQAIATILEPAGTGEQPLTVAVAGATGFVGGGIAAELRRRGHHVIGLSQDRIAAGCRMTSSCARLTFRPVKDCRKRCTASTHWRSPWHSPICRSRHPSAAGPSTRLTQPARNGWSTPPSRPMSGISSTSPAQVRHPTRRGTGFVPSGAPRRPSDASDIPFTIVRPTWVYGPRDVSLNRFLGFARQLQVVPLPNTGRQLLAPVFIDDVARLVADSLLADQAIDQTFEIGGPDTMRLRDIIARAMRVSGLNRPIVPGPTPLLKLGAAFLSWLPSHRLPPMPSTSSTSRQPPTWRPFSRSCRGG